MVRSLRRIIAVGHSLGITLPRRLLRTRGLSRGALVEVVPVEEGLLVRSATLAPAARAAPAGRHMGAWAALAPLKAGLSRIYGTRLKSVHVYRPDLRGIYGRPASGPQATRLRALIVLDAVPDYESEIQRTGDLISRLSVQHVLSISRVFVFARDWTKHRSEGFVMIMKREVGMLLDKAMRAIYGGRILLRRGDTDLAVLLAYCSMRYTACALLAERGVRVHGGAAALRAVGQRFVATGELPDVFHRRLLDARDRWIASEYRPGDQTVASDVRDVCAEALEFLLEARRVLERRHRYGGQENNHSCRKPT